MTGMINVTVFACLMYNAFTALIRFLYVSSSLRKNVQDVYKRDEFVLCFICLGEGINIFNIVSIIIQQIGKDGKFLKPRKYFTYYYFKVLSDLDSFCTKLAWIPSPSTPFLCSV